MRTGDVFTACLARHCLKDGQIQSLAAMRVSRKKLILFIKSLPALSAYISALTQHEITFLAVKTDIFYLLRSVIMDKVGGLAAGGAKLRRTGGRDMDIKFLLVIFYFIHENICKIEQLCGMIYMKHDGYLLWKVVDRSILHVISFPCFFFCAHKQKMLA